MESVKKNTFVYNLPLYPENVFLPLHEHHKEHDISHEGLYKHLL